MRWDGGQHLAWPGTGQEREVHLPTLSAPVPPLPASLPCQISASTDQAVYTVSLATPSISQAAGLWGFSTLLLSEPLSPRPCTPLTSFLVSPPSQDSHSPKLCALSSSHSRALICSQQFIWSFAQWRHGAIMCSMPSCELDNRFGGQPLPMGRCVTARPGKGGLRTV